MSAGELLVEVRAEEIPARMLEPAARELATRLFEDLTTRGLAPREVDSGYTPRRLAVVLRGLAAREPDREEQLLGPPVRVAFGADGAPTPATTGFARKCGVGVEDLQRIDTAKGEYLVVVKAVAGRPAAEVLAEMVPRILAGIAWAKNMRWGHGIGPWVRPVHGLLVLFDGELVPCELFGVASRAESVGHPVLSPSVFAVADAATWQAELAARGVEVKAAARREAIASRLQTLAAAAGGRLVEDAELLHKLAAICEIPGVCEGRFDPAFLSLPREVLTTSLKDHQSAFTVEGPDGRLLPLFLTVMDRPDDPRGHVRSGNEWVVAARLEDARFFYREDQKQTMAEREAALARRTFHVELGSYADKAGRLEALAEHLCLALGKTELVSAAKTAARLLKADLSTQMVGEFASLQGIMGGLYAADEGFDAEIWQGIYDQYLPASAEDTLPRSELGRIVGVADRLDTLAGIFGLGLVPSGSKDPFGLRRAAQGSVRMLVEGRLALDLEAAARHAIGLYGARIERSADAVLADLQPFLLDRVRHLLGQRGFAYDEIEATIAAGASDLPDLVDRTAAVHEIRERPGFLDVALAAKRIANILKGEEPHPLDRGLFVEAAERELDAATTELATSFEAAASRRDYAAALAEVARLAPALDRFFVEVLVMAEDPALRRNRIALLQAIDRIVGRVARLNELVVDKAEARA